MAPVKSEKIAIFHCICRCFTFILHNNVVYLGQYHKKDNHFPFVILTLNAH